VTWPRRPGWRGLFSGFEASCFYQR
jgi:hypothetical protein